MFNRLRPCFHPGTDIMHRPSNPSTTLALTALIMAAGTSAHAQFNFMMDQPLNPSETGRRGARNEDAYYSQRPAQPAYAAPRPERKGFFGRLFSRDEEPRYQPPHGNYDQPAGTYQVPVAAPAAARWPAAQPIAPQYQPQTYANPQWPQPAAAPPGTVTSFPIGTDPGAGYAAPAAPAPAAGSLRAMPVDAFTGQRPARSDFAAPAQPAAPPQWPAAQPVQPQFAPQGFTTSSWSDAPGRTIGAQVTPPAGSTVVPPSGQARPLGEHVVSDGVRYAPGAVPQGQAIPEGYPMPDTRYRSSARDSSLDRPGFFSRIFGLGNNRERERDDATRRWSPPPQNPAPALPHYQPQPDYNLRALPAAVPAPAPSFAPAQDPFSGQRPARRGTEPALEVPQPFPVPPTRAWPAPRSAVDSPPGGAPVALPAHVTPAEARAFSPLDA